MSLALVQQANNFSFSTGQPSLSLGSNVTKGNLLVAWMSCSSPTLPTIVDGGANAWIPLATGTASFAQGAYFPNSPNGVLGNALTGGYGVVTAWYCIVRSTRALTVTFFDTQSRNIGLGAGGVRANLTSAACQVMEFSGNSMNPFDAVAQTTGSSISPAESVTVTGPADLILGISITATGNICVETAGWTNAAGALTSFSAIYEVQSSAGTFTPTFLSTPSETWGVIAVGFKAVGPTHTISGSLGSLAGGASVLFYSNTTGIIYSATADGFGNYVSPGLENDSYTIQPQLVGVIFAAPRTQMVTISGGNSTGNNFTALMIPTSPVYTTTGVDTFQRANEFPLNPAAWATEGGTVPPHDPGIAIVSNEGVIESGTIINDFAGPFYAQGVQVYIGAVFGLNQWAEIKLDALNSTNFSHLWLHMQTSIGSGVIDNFKNFIHIINNGDGTINLQGISVGTVSLQNLWRANGVAFTPGDVFRLACLDNVFYVYQNGTLIGNYVSPNLVGNPGLTIAGLNQSDTQISHFQTGTVAPEPSGTPWALVQEANNGLNFASANPNEVAYVSPVGKGNLLIAWITSTSIQAPTDTLGNTWTQIGSTVINGYGSLAAYWAVANAAGNTTVNFGNRSLANIEVLEFSGNSANPFDTSTQITGTGTTLSQSITPSVSNELVLGFGIGGSGLSIYGNSGWGNVAGIGTSYSAIYNLENTTSPVTPAFTQSSSGPWGIITAAFKSEAIGLTLVNNFLGFAVNGVGSQTTGTFSSTTGNLLVVAVRVGGSTVSGVQTAAGASFTPLTQATSGTIDQQFFYLKNIVGNPLEAITVSFVGGTSGTSGCWVWEISGADTVSPSDVDKNGIGAWTSPITSSSFSTLLANEIILALATVNASGTTDFAAQSGYTLDSTPGAPTVGIASGFIGVQHSIVSSIQTTVTSDMTFTGGTSGTLTIINVASFKAAAPSSFSISGNAGVAGATVSWSGLVSGSTTADGSGNYTTQNLPNGVYTITPSLAGYTFSPTSANETVNGSNITGVNFTATKKLVGGDGGSFDFSYSFG